MTTNDPCTHRLATSRDGAVLTACAHGGQILGWTPAGEQADRLWLSPLARCGPGEAIRGGVPVIFPQFAARGPLPKHGLARDRTWELEVIDGTSATTDTDGADTGGADTGGAAVVRARLRDDDATRLLWPHRFTLTLTARAHGTRLTLTLEVRNDGDDAFSFTAALHAYLSVLAPAAGLRGPGGADAEPNATPGSRIRLPEGPLRALEARDVAVRDHVGPDVLEDGARCLEMAREGFDDLVVWNPGPDHGLVDVPAQGASSFVCLEPARLSPVRLSPAQSWSARAVLTAALVPGPTG